MMKTAALLAFALLLSACGDNASRYLIETPAAEKRASLRVQSIEVRDVSLPAYSGAVELVAEDADGALKVVKNAVWADDPTRGVTAALATSIAARSTASVAAEPWPLDSGPDVRVEVRVDRMVARADGTFQLRGQYAVTSPNQRVREFLERFDLTVPVEGTSAAQIAQANSAAIDALAAMIIAKLR